MLAPRNFVTGLFKLPETGCGMNSFCLTSRWTPWLIALFVLPAALAVAGAKTPATPAQTNSLAADPHQWEIPPSVFRIPTNPREGRDPFFPNAVMGVQPTKPKEAPVDISGFVLNGITSPPKRTAMINGRTFEIGETGEVKLPSGARVLIKCLEIKNESAVIDVNGQRQELRMRFGV